MEIYIALFSTVENFCLSKRATFDLRVHPFEHRRPQRRSPMQETAGSATSTTNLGHEVIKPATTYASSRLQPLVCKVATI